MRVTRIKIETLIVKVVQTRDVEASCDDCARLSAKLVEVLFSGQVTDAQLSAIVQHLQECIPCSEEFKALQECARMDMEDSWPSLEDMWRTLDQNR
jgi:hypothetical protein